MNTSRLSIVIATLALSWLPSQAGTEVERLRALVAEQERQIRMLEQEIFQLKADSQPRGTGSRSANLNATGTTPVSAPPAPQASRPASSREYTVVAGDTLMRIGRQFGVSATTIAKANGLDSSGLIRPGQKLKIPGGNAAPSPSPTAASSAAPAASSSTPAQAPAAATHTVKSGETFYSIARQHGVAVDRLIAANPGTSPSALRVGQNLRLPQASAAPTTTPVAATGSRAPVALPDPAPAAAPAPPPAPQPQARNGARTVLVEKQMTYGAFAAQHGTTAERLNQINGLDLDARTVLASGSELYVPAQP